MFTEKMTQGTDAIKHTIEGVDKKVKENPWRYVATAAVSAFLLGFLLNRNRNK